MVARRLPWRPAVRPARVAFPCSVSCASTAACMWSLRHAATASASRCLQGEFFHNGYIKSLKQLVHFYNTRDALPMGLGYPVTSGHCPPGTVERVTCWPQPEVPNNIDMTTGDLGLTDTEENQIVAFLQTLTDGYDAANPTVSTYV